MKDLVDDMMNTTDFHHLVDLVIAASDLYEISDAVRDVDLCIQPSCLALYQRARQLG